MFDFTIAHKVQTISFVIGVRAINLERISSFTILTEVLANLLCQTKDFIAIKIKGVGLTELVENKS